MDESEVITGIIGLIVLVIVVVTFFWQLAAGVGFLMSVLWAFCVYLVCQVAIIVVLLLLWAIIVSFFD